jgi:transposase
MARYRPVDMSPRFLPAVLEEQRVPGTFADAVHRLVDLLDLSAFDAHDRNDATGAPAHAPGMLLKAVLLAYSQGIVSKPRHEVASA